MSDNISCIVAKAVDHISVYHVWNRFLFRPGPSAVFKIKFKTLCFGNSVGRRPCVEERMKYRSSSQEKRSPSHPLDSCTLVHMLSVVTLQIRERISARYCDSDMENLKWTSVNVRFVC
jgi:hypothetical protein